MEITDGNMRRMVAENLNAVRAKGLIARGASTYTVYRVNEPEDVDGEERVAVYGCMDSTEVETLDATTREPANATPPRLVDFKLFAADRGGWKVVNGGNKEVESCP